MALGAAIALFVASASMQAQVNAGTMGPDGRIRSTLTGSQAQAASGTASVLTGVGAASGAFALGLGTTAVLLW